MRGRICVEDDKNATSATNGSVTRPAAVLISRSVCPTSIAAPRSRSSFTTSTDGIARCGGVIVSAPSSSSSAAVSFVRCTGAEMACSCTDGEMRPGAAETSSAAGGTRTGVG